MEVLLCSALITRTCGATAELGYCSSSADEALASNSPVRPRCEILPRTQSRSRARNSLLPRPSNSRISAEAFGPGIRITEENELSTPETLVFISSGKKYISRLFSEYSTLASVSRAVELGIRIATQSARLTDTICRALPPNHRCRCKYSGNCAAKASLSLSKNSESTLLAVTPWILHLVEVRHFSWLSFVTPRAKEVKVRLLDASRSPKNVFREFFARGGGHLNRKQWPDRASKRRKRSRMQSGWFPGRGRPAQAPWKRSEERLRHESFR